MSPELEELLRHIILLLYEQDRDMDDKFYLEDKTYLDLADEINAIIIRIRAGGE